MGNRNSQNIKISQNPLAYERLSPGCTFQNPGCTFQISRLHFLQPAPLKLDIASHLPGEYIWCIFRRIMIIFKIGGNLKKSSSWNALWLHFFNLLSCFRRIIRMQLLILEPGKNFRIFSELNIPSQIYYKRSKCCSPNINFEIQKPPRVFGTLP